MDMQVKGEDRIPFSDPGVMFDGFTGKDIAELAYCAGDVMLAIDADHIIRDVAMKSADYELVSAWIGQQWSDTVTLESRPKIERMLDSRQGHDTTWRQVNHNHDGGTVPVKYRVIKPANSPWMLAIGRDLRTFSDLQQRLLKTQQSMERDYLNLRQTETRYRLLFDNISYPVLIVAADDLKIQQANRALHALINAAPGSLDGKNLSALVDQESRDRLITHIAAASVSNISDHVEVKMAGAKDSVKVSMSSFRQSGKKYWLINIGDGLHDVPAKQSDRHILDVVEKMPDAFVLTNSRQEIIVANLAFAELLQAGSTEQLLGVSLSRFIGRPEIDLGLLKKQLKDHLTVRNFSSVVNDLNGGEEPVEISAIMVDQDEPLIGYSIRTIGRRERDLPGTDQEFPRSVDQLTELVGRKPLKVIVRESTDLIERMCIEAALVHTSDNRASAAEILGLSRQSLYSKLHRHNLGNLSGDD